MKTLNLPNGIAIETAKEFAKRFPENIQNQAAQMKHGLYVFADGLWRPFDSRVDSLNKIDLKDIVLIEHRDYFTATNKDRAVNV